MRRLEKALMTLMTEDNKDTLQDTQIEKIYHALYVRHFGEQTITRAGI